MQNGCFTSIPIKDSFLTSVYFVDISASLNDHDAVRENGKFLSFFGFIKHVLLFVFLTG